MSRRSDVRTAFRGGVRIGLVLLVLAVLLVPTPGLASTATAPGNTAAPIASLAATFLPSSLAAPAFSPVASPIASVSPQITAAYDWDPQPFVLPPSFPIVDIAGEGAVMVTSDLYGTVVLFGGEGPSALTNLTITVNETTAVWTVAPQPPGPSPRANASFVTVDGGRKAVLFGGTVNLSTGASDNETWVYDFPNGTWTNVTGPIAPPPRESAAMASDMSSNLAVLEGGWDPFYTVGGAGASVIWNDTWTLNLTDFNWTRQSPAFAPRPMFGSSMVFDPPSGAYLLFGGCAAFCSNALYSYRPGGTWTHEVVHGEIPAPRGAASSAYLTLWNLTFITGGFQWGGNAYAPFNDTFVYTSATHTWDLMASFTEGPSARFGSAASFLMANGCPGVLLLGGSTALDFPPPDGWFLDQNPDYGNGCDNWGGDQVGGGGGPPANCTPTTFLNVTVLDNSNQLPIPGATVQVAGICGTLNKVAGPTGAVNFSALPNETARVMALSGYYHTNSTFVNLSLPGSEYLVIRMDPLPSVHLFVQGVRYPNVTAPIDGASISLAPSLPLGNTSGYGWLNITGFAGPLGPNTFLANKPEFSNGSATVNIPYTGLVTATITLLAYGAFDVHVMEYPDGVGIINAAGVINPVGAYTFGGPINYVTGPGGWFNITLPQANYSVSAASISFLSNSTRLPVFHHWVTPTVVPINLTLRRGADLSVRLVDASTHQPIELGAVQVGYLPVENTSASGWANFTNILPPGWYAVAGSASGYRPNATAVDLTYRAISQRVFLNLTPLPGCGDHCVTATNGTTGPFRLLPSSGAALDAIILAPTLLVLAGIVYALYVRRRAEAPT